MDRGQEDIGMLAEPEAEAMGTDATWADARWAEAKWAEARWA